MAYLINKKHIFLHIPKTGGTWVDYIIKNSKIDVVKIGHNKHATYDYVCANLNFNYDKSRTLRRVLPRVMKNNFNFFCVVRNPLTWYESLFNHLTRSKFKKFGQPGNHFNWHIWSKLSEIEPGNFNGFMEQMLKIAPGYASFVFDSYILNSNSLYLKKESLRYDLLKLSRRLDINFNEDLIFSSHKKNVSDQEQIFWDEGIYKKILYYDKVSFEKFDYDTSNIVQIL